jgi:hypothetical protein
MNHELEGTVDKAQILKSQTPTKIALYFEISPKIFIWQVCCNC